MKDAYILLFKKRVDNFENTTQKILGRILKRRLVLTTD